MRTVFFFENRVSGGGSKYVIDCINGVLARGDDVVLLSNSGALSDGELEQLAGPLALQPVTVFERTQSVARLLGKNRLATLFRKLLIVSSPLLLLLNVLELWRWLKRLQPEVFVACNGGYPAAESALASVLAARLHGIPSVLVIMSQPQARRNALLGYERILDWLVLSSAEMFVLNSARQGRALVDVRGALAERVCTVYNGIAEADSVRSQPPLDGPGIVLGVVCRLDPMKGLDDLIRALAQLSDQPELTLRIVGDGEYRKTLQALAQQLDVADRVVFAGFKSGQELIDEYDGFDIFVFPSHWEGLPYALLEAMRAGLPIITTSVGGIPEAVRDMREGLLVPPHSPEMLKDAIIRLLGDRVQALRLGAAARERFAARFTLQKMQADFASVVSALRSAQPRR